MVEDERTIAMDHSREKEEFATAEGERKSLFFTVRTK